MLRNINIDNTNVVLDRPFNIALDDISLSSTVSHSDDVGQDVRKIFRGGFEDVQASNYAVLIH